MAAGDVAGGLALMSSRQPRDFPPHWSPFGADDGPTLAELWRVLATEPVAPWVARACAQALYRQRLGYAGPELEPGELRFILGHHPTLTEQARKRLRERLSGEQR